MGEAPRPKRDEASMTREEAIAEFSTAPWERPQNDWHTAKDDPYLCAVCHREEVGYDRSPAGVYVWSDQGAHTVCPRCFDIMKPLPRNWGWELLS